MSALNLNGDALGWNKGSRLSRARLAQASRRKNVFVGFFALLVFIVGFEYMETLQWLKTAGQEVSHESAQTLRTNVGLSQLVETAASELTPSRAKAHLERARQAFGEAFDSEGSVDDDDDKLVDADALQDSDDDGDDSHDFGAGDGDGEDKEDGDERGYEVGNGDEVSEAARLAELENEEELREHNAHGGEVPDPNVSSARLPRTTSYAYNELDPTRKYFIYSPSGGWNNQLACLLNALELARMSGRDLVVPPMARHSDMYTGYLKVHTRATAPMDMVLDLGYLEESSGVRVLPLNVSLERFYQEILPMDRTKVVSVPKGETLIAPKNRGLYNTVESWVQDSQEAVVYYRGPFFSRHWVDWELGGPKSGAWEHLRYAPYLKELADRVKAEFFPRGYNALHIRMGDYLARLQGRAGDGSKQWVKGIRSLGWSPLRPLYVATDMPGSSPHFNGLRGFADKIFFMANVEDAGVVDDFRALVPHTKLQADIFGLVEQLICVDANNWIGSYFSTFSLTINMMRGDDEKSRLMTSFGKIRKRHRPSANTA